MIEDPLIFDIIRLLIGTLILAYASYTDIKTRRAANYLWIAMAAIGGILLIIQYLTTGISNIMLLIMIPIWIGLMWLFFQLRLLFGGADAKALMAIGLLVPFHPVINSYPLWDSVIPFFPWTIFTNSVVLFLIIPLSLCIYNLLQKNIEFPYLFLGYKIGVQKARNKYVWPLEKYEDGKRKFSYMPTQFETNEEWDAFEKRGIKHIWVTPKIPFMIPLLAGYLFSFFFGDLLSQVMQTIL